MSIRTLVRRLKPEPLPRNEGISNRLVVVGMGGRFMDELLSGLPIVLMPTLRRHLGLSYTQVSLTWLAMNTTSAVVEPIAGLLIDIWKRPWIMACGAAGIGLGTAVMGLAPTFALLLAGFAIYGLASGPVAHTGDVVLVEAYPGAPDRIFTRATIVDTLGALLSPLLVSLTFWLNADWRWLLAGLGLSSVVYAMVILRTTFPPAAGIHERQERSLRETLSANVRRASGNRQVQLWLLFLFILDIAETPVQFTSIWLDEEVGLTQAVIGLYVAMGMAVSVVSLIVLDRWLARAHYRRILLIACLGVLLMYPAWLLLPGALPRFLLAVPIGFLFAVFWPISRAQSLASEPGHGGTVTAIYSIIGLFPTPLLFGLSAEAVGLTRAMFWFTMGSLLIILCITLFLNTKGHSAQQST